jgi:heme oxygenase
MSHKVFIFLKITHYIKAIPAGLSSNIRLFGNNIIAYMAIKSSNDGQHLQQDLDKYVIWEGKWKKNSLHPDKCNIFSVIEIKTVSNSTTPSNGQPLESLEEAKYLVVTI